VIVSPTDPVSVVNVLKGTRVFAEPSAAPPPEVNGELKPESFTVRSGQHAKAEFQIDVYPSARPSTPKPTPSVASERAREFVFLVLRRDGYEIGYRTAGENSLRCWE
jgi:hypothetical protein